MRQARGPTAGLPVKEHVAARTGVRPQVTLACAAMPRFQVGDGRLVHLHVAAGEHARADRVIDGPQPVGGQAHPARQGLPGQMHAVALAVDRFLPVERQMIAYLAMSTCASSPAVGRPRSCRQGGKGAMIGVASASPRRTNLRRMSRRRRKRAGS